MIIANSGGPRYTSKMPSDEKGVPVPSLPHRRPAWASADGESVWRQWLVEDFAPAIGFEWWPND